MPNKRFSDLDPAAALANVWVPGYDLTQPPSKQNVKFSMQSLMAGIGDGQAPVVITVTGINLAVGASTTLQLNQPLANDTDVAVLGLTLQAPQIAAALYNLLIYQGDPSLSSSKILFNY